MITWLVGPRDLGSAHPFISDLADRIRYRPQITSDGLGCYVSAVEDVLGADADFAQIIKLYGKGDDNETTAARYSPPTGSPAEAGTGAEVISERITDSVKFRRAWMRRHGLESHLCRIVKVTGESMEPTLPTGASIAGRGQRPTFAPTL